MLYLRMLRLFLILFLCPLALYSVEKEHVILHESFISPDIEDFDCHGSSLIEVSPGILCAAWKGDRARGTSNCDMTQNVGIWISLCIDGKWNPPEQIVKTPHSVSWTPVLTKLPIGELRLFYRVGSNPRHTISLYKSSTDGGINWSQEEILPAGIVGPTKSKPVFDTEGNMICGSSVETGEPEEALKATACWIEILSNDNRWTKYGPIEIPGKRFGCIEPALFWGQDGTLKMVCRDRSHRIGSEGWIWIAESSDKGKTWSELQKTELPNPDSGIDAVSLDPKKVFLAYNQSHCNRFPLTIALSQDSGTSWIPLFDIEKNSGEFPSILLDSQGHLHVTYAWTPPGKIQRKIKYLKIGMPESKR